MSEQQPEQPPVTSLPEVEEAVLARFSQDQPDFDTLFDRLKTENPRLAWWLIREAQKLAPDINDKEKYAELALRLHGVLRTQVAQNLFREQVKLDLDSLDLTDSTEPIIPGTGSCLE